MNTDRLDASIPRERLADLPYELATLASREDVYGGTAKLEICGDVAFVVLEREILSGVADEAERAAEQLGLF